MEFIKEEMKDIIYYFGYAKIAEDPNNVTPFYDYPKTDPELYKKYYGYKELNEQSIGWNAYMTDEERALIQFMCSDPDKSAEVPDFHELITLPLLHANFYALIINRRLQVFG